MATPQEPDAEAQSGYVVTIGTYDGVHLGHQQLIAATQQPRPPGRRQFAAVRS